MTIDTALFVRVVRVTMLIGAIYDLVFAVWILASPQSLAPLISVPMPEQEIYLRFLGVFLAALAIFYLMPVLYPGRYFGNVAGAAVARSMGAAFLVIAVLAYHQPPAFLLLGAADLAFAVVHYLSLVPFTGPRVWRIGGVDISPRGGFGGF